VLAAGELTLGATLLLPVIPTGLAGLGLAALSAGLLGLYLRTPGAPGGQPAADPAGRSSGQGRLVVRHRPVVRDRRLTSRGRDD
jgi:hypothetical protein